MIMLVSYTKRYSDEGLVAVLRDFRIKRNVSQSELAKRLGVAPSHISRIEHGSDPRVSTFVEMARALQAEPVLVPREHLSAVRALLDDLERRHTDAPERPRFA
jgi:transcriptional regulator with XRE-family HTH domain